MNLKSLLEHLERMEALYPPQLEQPHITLSDFTSEEQVLVRRTHELMERAQLLCDADTENAKTRLPKGFTHYMTPEEREICRQGATLVHNKRKGLGYEY